MITIDRELVSGVTEQAKSSPRLRKNHNFHADYADPVNRMLNAFEPGTYVRPHKHESPDKCEVFIVLTGKAVALWFAFYNFYRLHRALRVTPAMAAGIADHIWGCGNY